MKRPSLYLALTLAAATVASAAPVPGQLMPDPTNPHALVRAGGGPVFICGPGDPEDFLYRGERQRDGTRKGDQMELIAKLARHGGNSIYMQAVRTHGGDAKQDRTHNPFVDSDPAKGVDDRILAQWEQWFLEMDRHEILIYFLFYDDGAKIWRSGGTVEPAERTFFETIVRRFKHHRNLIWVIGEESEEAMPHARVQALAKIIRAADDHGHIIGNHHLSGVSFRSWAPQSALTHYSMQLNPKDGQVHAGALEARARARGRYQVFYAENTAIAKDTDSMRRFAWDAAMAGLIPMILQMDIASTPPEALAQCRALQKFFEGADYASLSPHDELADSGARYVLAEPGRSYVAYTHASPTIGLRGLPAGRAAITWLDVVTGRQTSEERRLPAGNQTLARPAGIGPECAVWVRFPDVSKTPRAAAPVAAMPDVPAGPNQTPRVNALRVTTTAGTAVYAQLRFSDEDGPGPYVYTIVEGPRHGKLTGTDNDRTYEPAPGFVGSDSFTWMVSDGAVESAPARVTIEVGIAR